QDPRQHVLRVRLALPGRARIPLLSDGAVGRTLLPVEIEISQQALTQRIAGIGGQLQPLAGQIDVAFDAPTVDEAAADLSLCARDTRMTELNPNGERALEIAAAGSTGRISHALSRLRNGLGATLAHRRRLPREGGSRAAAAGRAGQPRRPGSAGQRSARRP